MHTRQLPTPRANPSRTNSRNQPGRLSRAAVALVAALAAADSAHAASADWNVDANGNWATAGSWNPAAAPGSTTATNSTDVASFIKTLTAGRTVTVDANRNIGGITFDHADAFAYTFSTTGNLRLSSGGVIQSAANNGNHQDAVVTRIDIQGDGGSAAFTANASSSGSLLTIGNSAAAGTTSSVQGVSTAGNTTTLTLNGSSVGTGLGNATTNSIVGRILNGSSGGNLAIVKSGTGTWRIGGDNTYTGGTTVNAGTLSVGRTTALGTGSVTVNGPGILDIGGAGSVTGAISDRVVSGNGTITLSNLGTTPATSFALTSSSVASDYSGFTGTWNIGSSSTAAGTAGRAIMNGATTSTSTVNVVANATLSASVAVTHNAAVTLNGGDTGEANGQLRLEGGAVWAGNVTLAGNITGTGDSSVGAVTTTGTISGVISESGGSRSLSKGGSGTIILTNANTYSGNTFVNAGALNVQNTKALGNGSSVTVASGGRLELQGGLTFTGKDISIAGNGGNFFGALQSKAGTNVWAGNVTLAADGTRLGAAAGATLEVSGVIDSGANLFGVTYRPENSTATVVLSGANTYIGSTSIIGGVVSASSLNRVVGGSASSNLGAPTTVASGTISIGNGAAGTLRYTGTGETTDRVINLAGTTFGATLEHSGTGLLKFSSDLTATGAGAKALTLQGSTAGVGELSGAIVDSTGFATSLTKAGTGSWALTGTSSYTGTTAVTEGTLIVDGSLLGTGALSVAAPAVLRGTGSIAGNSTITGTLAPGKTGTLGTLSFGGTLDVPGTIALRFDSSSGIFDSISANGISLTAATLSLVDISAGALVLAPNSTYTLLNNTSAGSISGTFLGLSEGASLTVGLNTFFVSYTGGLGGNDFVLTAVPEPATAAAVTGFVMLFAAVLRRRASRK